MATRSGILDWKIPQTEKPSRLQSMEQQRVGHDWATEHTQITVIEAALLTAAIVVPVAALTRGWNLEPAMKAYGLPTRLRGSRIHLQCGRRKRNGFDSWVRKIPCRRKWQPTPVFLPWESHGPGRLQTIGLQRVGHDWSERAHMH